MKSLPRTDHDPLTIRVRNWEYWPSWAFYLPLAPFFAWQALRSGHPCFFSAANPGLFAGGIGLESKFITWQMLPPELRPATVLARPGMAMARIEHLLLRAGIDYPLVAKPDIGSRGRLVDVIHTPVRLESWLQRHQQPFLLQQYIDYPEEVGLFYYRYPDQQRGVVSSLTLKQFLTVYGDGRRSLRELIHASPRARLQLEALEDRLGLQLEDVPPPGVEVVLSRIGNHTRGARFVNGNHLIDEQLTGVIDRLADRLPGFCYGRFDIRCRSLEDLRQGQHFTIIELNGVCSEPTHIYDSESMSYSLALESLLRHWQVCGRIARQNHRRGVPYLKVGAMLRALAARP